MAESTTNSSLSARRSSGSRSKKKRKNQIPLGILFFLILVAVGFWLNSKGSNLVLFWITGLGFGFVLQRARFCFTASMRDPYLTGSVTLTKAVLIAFALTSIGFTAIKYGAFANGLPIPGQSYVAPVSFATAVGAFIFGIGMVIAGGCASGTLMRVGEGFWMQVISLFFFIVGSLWGAHDYGWWDINFISKGPEVFLPDYLGWVGGLAANLLIIAVVYIIAHKWGNRKQDEV
jgi:uncharacterized membrane protein YedE/YeeE